MNKKGIRNLGDAILNNIAIALEHQKISKYTWDQEINHKTNTITTKITIKEEVNDQ